MHGFRKCGLLGMAVGDGRESQSSPGWILLTSAAWRRVFRGKRSRRCADGVRFLAGERAVGGAEHDREEQTLLLRTVLLRVAIRFAVLDRFDPLPATLPHRRVQVVPTYRLGDDQIQVAQSSRGKGSAASTSGSTERPGRERVSRLRRRPWRRAGRIAGVRRAPIRRDSPAFRRPAATGTLDPDERAAARSARRPAWRRDRATRSTSRSCPSRRRSPVRSQLPTPTSLPATGRLRQIDGRRFEQLGQRIRERLVDAAGFEQAGHEAAPQAVGAPQNRRGADAAAGRWSRG